MYQGQNSSYTKTPFKAIGYVENNQNPGNNCCHQSISYQLAANSGTNLFLTENSIIANLILQAGHNSLAFILLQIHSTNHYILGCLYIANITRQLNSSIIKIVFSQYITNLRQGNFLLELHFNNGTACKINTKVKALGKHAENTRDDNQERENEPDFGTAHDIKRNFH